MRCALHHLVVHDLEQSVSCIFFFFNDTATTEIYTLSLHDALPIWPARHRDHLAIPMPFGEARAEGIRSEEHTSELQSRSDLVCRLLLEKKKKFSAISPQFTLSSSITPYLCIRCLQMHPPQ